MHRTAVFMLVMVVFCIAVPISGTARDVATPTTTTQLDLAAMTLTPADVAAAGLAGYGLANQSSMRDAKADALVQADGDALEAAVRLAVYQENGFQARYVGSLLRPVVPLESFSSGLVAAESRITTAVTKFASEAGATAAFAFNEGEMDDAPGEDVPGSRTFGDESELTRSTGSELETGAPLQRLELAVQLENLIAEVIVVDYGNAEPEIATVETLGEALLRNIERERVRELPGLSPRVLRLSPMAPWILDGRLRDFYVRFDETTEPTFAEIVTAAEAGETVAPESGDSPDGVVAPESTYMFWTPVGTGDPLGLPLYVVWLDQYHSAEQAAAAISGQSDDLGDGYVDVQEFFAGETIGDQSRAFVYTYEGDPSGPVRGHLVIARAGDVVIRLQVDGPDGVSGSSVRDLAQAQVDCLESAGSCPPLPALSVLASLVVLPGETDE